MGRKFYITCAIPYVNAKPHVGHALEFVQGDVIARYHKLLGEDVILLSGGDENALKNVQAAEKANEPIQEFVDKNNKLFVELTKNLNCEFDIWQKGSDKEKHFKSSQKLWELCKDDIYQKEYEGLYCVGCEAFYSPEDLNENGECFEHPEKNYFFKLSKYQKDLIDLISKDKLKIYPIERKNEVLSFLKEPLQDISISRSNERAKNWGVPVPNDDSQKIYVWFDALNIYQSGIGFGWDEEKYRKYWPADLHIIGKGITRFHAVYWPAFLLSAGLKIPKALFVHGYFTVNGQKMSKTLGNVIDPNEIIEKYGADALRYYFLAKFQPFTDGDFSESKLKDVYNADLANGLGNLVSRVAKLCENSKFEFKLSSPEIYQQVSNSIKEFRFDNALKFIWEKITLVDKAVNKSEPWKLSGEILKETLQKYLCEIRTIALNLKPFLPNTSEKILANIGSNRPISEVLFPRL
ncbi:MAG: Methionine-tRNA ligase [Candidatus Woesebacteria bacterium GW2011_GWC2_33_12]|nr:MAG: Methionine-tRNA ligase [Candidatus Woesebacteria bacterium GW2011_GWC2_33_12]